MIAMILVQIDDRLPLENRKLEIRKLGTTSTICCEKRVFFPEKIEFTGQYALSEIWKADSVGGMIEMKKID